MSHKSLFGIFAGCAIAAFSSAGCAVQAGGSVDVTPPSASTGTLSVDWTIGGSTDPDACSSNGAYDFELIVYDDLGRPYTTTTAPCEDFAITVDLPEGYYSADATLIDAFSNAVTTTKTLDDIDVVAGSDLAIDLDFPLGSFL